MFMEVIFKVNSDSFLNAFYTNTFKINAVNIRKFYNKNFPLKSITLFQRFL